MRIIYDKGWYGRHLLKAIQNMTGDVPADSLCPLCKMPDSLRHWTSECQDNAMLTCRREILDSLPLPNGEKPLHQFTRAVSLIIPQLLRDTTEPERLWTCNLNTRLRQSLFGRLPATLRKTGINVARSGLRSALEKLAKGCHKLWVARHAAKRAETSPITMPGDESDDNSVTSLLSWVDANDTEAFQTCSVDDDLTPVQDDDESEQGEFPSPMSVDDAPPVATVRSHKQRINTDYIHKRVKRKNSTGCYIDCSTDYRQPQSPQR